MKDDLCITWHQTFLQVSIFKKIYLPSSNGVFFFPHLAHKKEINLFQDEERNAAHKLWIFWEWFFEEFFTKKYILLIFQIHSLPFFITHYAVMWAVITFISSTFGRNILESQAYLFIMNIWTGNIGRPSIRQRLQMTLKQEGNKKKRHSKFKKDQLLILFPT